MATTAVNRRNLLALSVWLCVSAACGGEPEPAPPAAAPEVAPAASPEVPAPEPAAAPGGRLIRDVRAVPGASSVEISFTSTPGAFGSVVIGRSAPRTMLLPDAVREAGGPESVHVMDPDAQVTGYVVRSRSASYRLDTSSARPEEGTGPPIQLEPRTQYHFLISVPAGAPGPGQDDDDMEVAEQYVGSFVTQ